MALPKSGVAAIIGNGTPKPAWSGYDFDDSISTAPIIPPSLQPYLETIPHDVPSSAIKASLENEGAHFATPGFTPSAPTGSIDEFNNWLGSPEGKEALNQTATSLAEGQQNPSFIGGILNQITDIGTNAVQPIVDKYSPDYIKENGAQRVHDLLNGTEALVNGDLSEAGDRFTSAVGDLPGAIVETTSNWINDVTSGFGASQGDPSGGYDSGSGAYSNGNPNDIDYIWADLAKYYGMDVDTAYQEALSNTSYQRMVKDLQAAGLNPILATGRSGASSDIYGTLANSQVSAGYGSGAGNASASSAKKLQGASAIVGAVIGLATTGTIQGAIGGASLGNTLSGAWSKITG